MPTPTRSRELLEEAYAKSILSGGSHMRFVGSFPSMCRGLWEEVSRFLADALMLRKLFRRLFHAGLIVVATSNRAPSELYLNGLQRASFLPFIADLEARCDVHRLGVAKDYRTLASAARRR